MDKQHFKEVFPSKRDGKAEIAEAVARQFIDYLDKECEEKNSHFDNGIPRHEAKEVPSISAHLQAAKARSNAEEKKRQSDFRKYQYQYGYLCKLLKGCTKGDYDAMENIEKTRDQVVCYNDDTRTTYVNHEVPWPVVFLLTRYHRKFIWINKRIPPIKSFAFSMHQICNKLKWACSLSKELPKGAFIKLGKGSKITPTCDKVIDAACEHTINLFRDHMFHVYDKVVMQAKIDTSREMENVPLVVKAALDIMKNKGYVAIPQDKDTGYVLRTWQEEQKAQISILAGPEYEEINRDFLNIENIKADYRVLAKEASQLMKDSMKMLFFSINNPESKWYSVLATSIKTHKEQGEIKYRNIHASVNYAFGGLSAWATRHMQKYTAKMNHLVNSTENMVNRLGRFDKEINEDSVLYKFDIKEFYMNGTSEELIKGIEMAMEILGPKIEMDNSEKIAYDRLTIRIVRFLLENQYIISEYTRNRVWKIKKGAGMGLMHSREVSSLAYFGLVEGVSTIKKDNMCMHKIIEYCRYEDDGIIIGRDRNLARLYLRAIMDQKKVWEIKYEGMVSVLFGQEIQLLNTYISLECGKIIIRPRVKGPESGIPLEGHSGHRKCVHKWPISTIKELTKYSTTIDGLMNARTTFIARFKKHLASKSLICELEAVDLAKKWSESSRVLGPEKGGDRRNSGMGKRIIIGHHPAWKTVNVQKEIKDFFNKPIHMDPMRGNIKGFESPTVVWKNDMPHAMHVLRKICKPKILPTNDQ